MLRIRTLGGLSVHGATRAPAGAATQPRRLAVLAYVARAGDRGVTREKLLAMLWPDADEDAGRRALSQSLYALRRDLDTDELFLGVQELKLNPEAATCDVLEFETALTERNLDRAADLYGGPFLDGFRLPGAGEFDRWVETERRALEQRHFDVLERLARRSTDRGDASGAAVWWRRIADLDPLNARIAVELMRSLVASGDPSGALKHARIYEALLAQELDVEPDRQVVELAQRIRAEAATTAGAGAATRQPAEPSLAVRAAVPPNVSPTRSPERDGHAEAIESPPPEPVTTPATAPATAAVQPARRRAAAIAGIAATVIALGAAAWWLSAGRRASAITPVLAVGRILDYRAADGRDADAVSDMLATNLARVPGLQVLSSARVYEVMGQSRDTPQSRGAVARAAQRAGATEVLEGGLHALADGRLMLDVRRVDLTSGAVRTAHRVEGSDVYAVVAQATTDLARGLDRPVGPLDPAEVSTRSLVAYRFYEEGLRSYGRGDYRGAERLLQAAVTEDSSFAIAAFYLVMTRMSLGVALPTDTWTRLLVLADRAPDRERLLIRGMAALAYGRPELQAIADTLAARYPNEVDAPYLQASARLQNADYLGAIPYINRVMVMDSLGLRGESARCRACDAMSQLIFAYASIDSLAHAERLAREYVRRQPKSARAWSDLAGILYARDRYEEALQAYRTAMSISAMNVYDRVFPAIGRVRAGDYEEADRLTRELMRVGSPVDAREARWVLGISLRYQGRWREALALTREEFRMLSDAERTGDAGRTHQSLVATILLESGRAREAAAVFDSLARRMSTTIPSGPQRARALGFHYALLASALSAAGDTTRLAIVADSAVASSTQSTSRRDAHLMEHVRGLLLAARGDTAGAITALERAIYSPTNGLTRTNRELGHLYVQNRRPRDAVRVLGAALRSTTLESGSLYVTRTELHELLARAFDDLGMADSAVVHYQQVLRALAHSDAEAQPRYDTASRRLSALGGHRQ